MLTDEISFFIMVSVSCAIAAWFGVRHGKEFALGAGMATSMLAGTWFEYPFFDRPINVSVATAVILLCVYCLHSWREIFRCYSLLDYLVGSLVIWHVVVDVYHGGEVIPLCAKAYGQWLLPYAAGRYSFLHRDSLKKLSPLFVTVVSIISVLAVIEAFTLFNFWEWSFCAVDDEVTRIKTLRFGMLYRAIGPVRNPIFLGIVLLTMLPYAIDLVSRSSQIRRDRIIGYGGLVLIGVGLIATVSRGPMLCVPLALIFGLAWYSRIARWSLAIATVVLALGVYTYLDTVIDLLESDGDDHTPSSVVVLDSGSEPVIYTGTRQRLFVPQVYGAIALKGGLLGYGSVASSGFPPMNLPGLPKDPATLRRLRNVDNSYINVALAFGWVGLALFVVLMVSAGWYALQLAPTSATYLYPTGWPTLVCFGCILFALMLEIFTVFWCFDYSFWVTFHIGAVAGLVSQLTHIRKGLV